jgi:hypothetical protein
MPGYTYKSRRFLLIAQQHELRAAAASNAKVRSVFLNLAQRYREMAKENDDPARWRPLPLRPRLS